MIKLNNFASKAIKVETELNESNVKYDTNLINEGIGVILDLLQSYDLDIIDVEGGDDVNIIISYDDAVNMEKDILRRDNLDDIPAVNDLAFLYDHDYFNYVYINGYARITPVTNDDVALEIDDIISYLKDNG